jgi:hypothetical protein
LAFDFKKEFREFYLPPAEPVLIDLPAMNFVAVRGEGDPNIPDGDYQHALELLYAISFTIKMSKMDDHRIEGYFDYVVPPLEGLWTQDGADSIDLGRKDDLEWISMIRLPDFVTKNEFDWAVAEVSRKKGLDTERAEFFTYREGLCVQCMHIGSYDEEASTMELMHRFIDDSGYAADIGERMHHEIYLSDPRRVAPEKLKTVLRTPVRRL